MTKITKEQISEMNKLLKEGKTITQIAKTMNLDLSLVQYHLIPEQRIKQIERAKKNYKKLSKKQKHERYLKRKQYQQDWFKNKYHTDENFRKDIIERSKKRKRELRK